MYSLQTSINLLADKLGGFTRIVILSIGAQARFLFQALTDRWHYSLIVEQSFLLGVRSLPLIFFISIFVGFISAMSFVAITGGIAKNYLGYALLKAVSVEMGPTFTGLILSARIGAKIASEIGSMKVSEQLDALTCLSLSPQSYIINPRILACVLMGPVFFIVSSITALFSAQLLISSVMGVSAYTYYNSMRLMFTIDPVLLGSVKSIVFSSLIGILGCYYGYTTTGGALGVGKATRDAVVTSSLSILLSNLLLTVLWP